MSLFTVSLSTPITFPHPPLWSPLPPCSSSLFQSQDSRSRADFEGTHILAGPAHGRQGWVVIIEFKLAALEVFPLKQCHTAVAVVLRHKKVGVDRSGPPKRIHSQPDSPNTLPSISCKDTGSLNTPRVHSISSISVWEAGMLRGPQPGPFYGFGLRW